MKNSLSKGTALVTGASSGIGAVYADLPPHGSRPAGQKKLEPAFLNGPPPKSRVLN